MAFRAPCKALFNCFCVSVSLAQKKAGESARDGGKKSLEGTYYAVRMETYGECHNNRYHINTAIMIYNSKNDFCICWLSFSLIRYSHFARVLSSVICSLLKRLTYCTVVAQKHVAECALEAGVPSSLTNKTDLWCLQAFFANIFTISICFTNIIINYSRRYTFIIP